MTILYIFAVALFSFLFTEKKWLKMIALLAALLAVLVHWVSQAPKNPQYSSLWNTFRPAPDFDRLREILNSESVIWQAVVRSDTHLVDKDGIMLLHMACRFPHVPPDIVEKLLAVNPEAASKEGGPFWQMPLHFATKEGAPAQVIEHIWDAYPPAIFHKDGTSTRGTYSHSGDCLRKDGRNHGGPGEENDIPSNRWR